MIIEVSGLPGVGKSTILSKLEEQSNNPSVIFDIKKYIVNRSFFSFKNTFYYDMIVFLKFHLLKRTDFILLYRSFGIIVRGKNSFFHKINLVRNTLKKLIIYRYAIAKEKVFVIDEGTIHILFNLFVSNEKKYGNEIIAKFLKTLPQPSKILVIDETDDVIRKRIISRGANQHKRLDFSDEKKIENFMSGSRKVVEIIKKKMDPIVYFNTPGVVDLNELKIKLKI